MANDIQMGGIEADRIFLDTDQTRDLEVLDLDTDPTGATPKDIAGWAITFDVRRHDRDSVALLTTAASIVGTYSATRSANTQRARVTLADTDLTLAVFGRAGGTYRHSWKRTTAGVEAILARGDIIIERATQAG
jgi:hypothetical protein